MKFLSWELVMSIAKVSASILIVGTTVVGAFLGYRWGVKASRLDEAHRFEWPPMDSDSLSVIQKYMPLFIEREGRRIPIKLKRPE